MNPTNVERLLAHEHFVRRLAASIVRDPATADDLVQQTWLAVLRAAPTDVERPRSWLARIVHRIASNERKFATRRAHHERQAARPERVEDIAGLDAHLDARLDVGRRLATAVAELPVEMRRVVLMRYHDDLGPRAIAERLGEPEPTIKSRLARARTRLRAALDSDSSGDRRSLVLGLAALGRAPTGVSTPAAAASSTMILFAMSKAKLVTVGFAAIAFVAAIAVWDEHDSIPALPSEEAPPTVALAPLRSAPPNTGADRPERREVESPAAPIHAPAHQPIDEPGVARVLAFDVEGRPATGVRIVGPADTEATTDDSGRAELPITQAGRIRFGEPGWMTLFEGMPAQHETRTMTVIGARAIAVDGRVTDRAGYPIADARVRIEVDQDEVRAQTSTAFEHSKWQVPIVDSKSTGEFSTRVATAADLAWLVVEHPRFETWRRSGVEIAEMQHDFGIVEVRLARRPPSRSQLQGIVREPDSGAVVARARVSLGGLVALTDSEGRFELDADPELGGNRRFESVFGDVPRRIVAVADGRQPGFFAIPVDPETGVERFPPFVEIVLGPASRSIAGTVVDHDRRPIPRAIVWLEDATFFSTIEGGQVVEALRSGSQRARGVQVTADEDGHFVIDRLVDRSYRLAALDAGTMARSAVVECQAGSTSNEITIDLSVLRDIEGRVVDRRGTPVSDASIRRLANVMPIHHAGRRLRFSSLMHSVVRSGDDGTFSLGSVPPDGVWFRIDSPEIFPLDIGYGEDTLPIVNGRLDLVVERQVRVQISLRSPGEAEAVAVEDDTDQRGHIWPTNFKFGQRVRTMRLSRNGDSEVFAVRDNTVRIVLLRDDRVVRKVPVNLAPGPLHRLEL